MIEKPKKMNDNNKSYKITTQGQFRRLHGESFNDFFHCIKLYRKISRINHERGITEAKGKYKYN